MKKKAQNYSEMIREMNFKNKTTQKKKCEIGNKEISKRQKAIEFAKKIKKPKIKKNLLNDDKNFENHAVSDIIPGITNLDDHLNYLEHQHNLYKEKIKNFKC